MFLQQSSAADVHWQYFSFVFGIPQSSHVSWQWRFKWNLILLGRMSCSQLTSIEQWHRSLFPGVYYCNISCFQSLVTSHVYMTLGIRQLAMFASKNRQVVQIRIRVSHVEAVVYTGSLVEPLWKDWGSLPKFGLFPHTILYKSCVFTPHDRPPLLKGHHLGWPL